MLRVLKIILLSVLMLGLISTVAIANMAAPWNPGDLVGEPTGSFRSLAIIREILSFDLRPLDQGKSARIIATYQLRNEGQPASVELVFISPSIKAGSVTVDGASVPSIPIKLPAKFPKLPPEWQPPETVPAISDLPLDKQPKNPYQVNSSLASSLRFTATLPKGEHQLQVAYDMQPSTYDASIYRDYQIAYILAPARSWAQFGVLEVSVNLPTGWKIATSLPMKRSGDTLRATFNGLPANSLGITTRPPVPPLINAVRILLQITGAIIGFISSWWLGEIAGRKAGQWGWGDFKVAGLAIAMMPLGGCLFCVIAWVGERLAWSLLMTQLNEPHISNTWSHGHNIVTFLVLVLGGFVSSIATMVAVPSSYQSFRAKASR